MKSLKVIWWALTVIPIILLILGYVFPSDFFSGQETIRVFVNSYGVLSPLVFILIQILQVVFTPISHYSVGLVGGYLFGTWYGFLYNWIGRVIGTTIAFLIGRLYGRNIIKHVVKPKTLKKYDKIFEKGKWLLFLMYFLPLFPDDELSYLAGFSSMKDKVFIPIMLLGHVSGSLSLAFLGSGVSSWTNPMFIFLTVITLVGGLFFVLFYKKLNQS